MAESYGAVEPVPWIIPLPFVIPRYTPKVQCFT